MSMIDQAGPAPRKVMTIFYVIDTSGSMSGARIASVNEAMKEAVPLLKSVAQANDDAEIRVAILEFSSGCSWVTPSSGPVGLEELSFNPLVASGGTDFTAALRELDKKLSRKEFLDVVTGAYAPVIILMSDGGPNADGQWPKALEQLKKNNWFKFAIKIAIDVEGGSDRDVLRQFTCGQPGEDNIILAKDTATLKQIIKKVSVRASEFQSHSKPIDTDGDNSTAEKDAANIIDQVEQELKEEQVDAKALENEWGTWS